MFQSFPIVHSFHLEKRPEIVYTWCILFGSDEMQKLKSKVNRFFFQHRDKGIRNLMLYIGIGNIAVYILTLFNPTNPLFFNLLCFDYEKLFSGEVWRLFSYVFCYLTDSSRPVLTLISLFFYYWIGATLEQYWGRLRFNIYYLCGIVLTDLVAILIIIVVHAQFGFYSIPMFAGGVSANYVNMSLLLAVATILPDEFVQLWFVLPVKMKWLAWLDVGLTVYGILDWTLKLIRFRMLYFSLFLALLIPLVAIVNYLIFFGKNAAVILPDFIRYRPKRKSWERKVAKKSIQSGTGAVRHAGNVKSGNARFRCTVCGRTELTHPKLEFRYCSKCAGYRCYCEEHIQNHVHITE